MKIPSGKFTLRKLSKVFIIKVFVAILSVLTPKNPRKMIPSGLLKLKLLAAKVIIIKKTKISKMN